MVEQVLRRLLLLRLMAQRGRAGSVQVQVAVMARLVWKLVWSPPPHPRRRQCKAQQVGEAARWSCSLPPSHLAAGA